MLFDVNLKDGKNAGWKPALLICRLEAYVPDLQAGSLRSRFAGWKPALLSSDHIWAGD